MNEEDRARYELSDRWIDREKEEYAIRAGGVEWLDQLFDIKGDAPKRKYISISRWLHAVALVPSAEITRFTDLQQAESLTIMWELADSDYTLDQLITEYGIRRAWAKEVLRVLALYKEHYRSAPATVPPAAPSSPPASPPSVMTGPPQGEEQGGAEENDNLSLPDASTATPIRAKDGAGRQRGGGDAAACAPMGEAVKGKKPSAAASPMPGGSASKKVGVGRKEGEAAASFGRGSAEKKGARGPQAVGGGGRGDASSDEDDFMGHDDDMEVDEEEEEEAAQKPRSKTANSRGKQSPSQGQREMRQHKQEASRKKVEAHRRQPRSSQGGGGGAGPSRSKRASGSLPAKGGSGKGRAGKEGGGAARDPRPSLLDLPGGNGKGKKRAHSSVNEGKDLKVKREKGVASGQGGKASWQSSGRAPSMVQLVKKLRGETREAAVKRLLEDMNKLLEYEGLLLSNVVPSVSELQALVGGVMEAWRRVSTSTGEGKMGVVQAAVSVLDSLCQSNYMWVVDTGGWRGLLQNLLKREGLGSLTCMALRDVEHSNATLVAAVLELAWRITVEYGEVAPGLLRTLGKTTVTRGLEASGRSGEGDGSTDEEGSDGEEGDEEGEENEEEEEEGDGELRFLGHVHSVLDTFVVKRDAKVASLALEVLAQLTIDRKNTLELGLGLGKSVCRAMETFRTYMTVLTPACGLIQNLAAEGSMLQEGLVRESAVSRVLEAYRVAQGKPGSSHNKKTVDFELKQETLETRCAGALWTLCRENAEVREMAAVVDVALTCCQKVVEGRGRIVHSDPRTHLESVTAGLVSNLAAGHADNQRRLGQGKACEAAVYIARNYRKEALLLEDACNAIWHLAMCPANRSKLVAAKGLDITMEVIKEAIKGQGDKRYLLEPSCDSFRMIAQMDRSVVENRQLTALDQLRVSELYLALKQSLSPPTQRVALSPEQQAAVMGAAMALAGWATGADLFANLEDRKVLLKVLAKTQVAVDWDAITFHLLTYCMGLLERTTFATDVQGSARKGEVAQWWFENGVIRKLNLIIQKALVKDEVEEPLAAELVDARYGALRQGLSTLWRLSSHIRPAGEVACVPAASARGQQLASELEGEKITLCNQLVRTLEMGQKGGDDGLVILALDVCTNLLNLPSYQAYLVRGEDGEPNLCRVLGDVGAWDEERGGEVPEVGVAYKVLGPMSGVASYTDARTREALGQHYLPEWWVNVLQKMPPQRSGHVARALKGLRNYVTVCQLEDGHEGRYATDVQAYAKALERVRKTKDGDAMVEVLQCLRRAAVGQYPGFDPYVEDVEEHAAVFLMNLADGELHRDLLEPHDVAVLEARYAATQDELGDKGACELVCKLLDRAQGSRQHADRRASYMGLLMNLVSRSTTNRTRLGSRACKLVVNVLKALPNCLRHEDEEILEWGLYVLAYLCTDHAANADTCRRMGAVTLAEAIKGRCKDKGEWSDVRTAAQKVLQVLEGTEEKEEKGGDKADEASREPDRAREEEQEGGQAGEEEEGEEAQEAEAASATGDEEEATTGTSTEAGPMQEGEEVQSVSDGSTLGDKEDTGSTLSDSDKPVSEGAVATEGEGRGQEEAGDQRVAGKEGVETGDAADEKEKEAAKEAGAEEEAGGATGKRGREEEERPVPASQGDEMQPAEKLPRTGVGNSWR